MDTGVRTSDNLSAASRLSSDFNRMSFDEETAALADASQVNPYASAFFSGSSGMGGIGPYGEATQRPSW
jgi:hypothetical protein